MAAPAYHSTDYTNYDAPTPARWETREDVNAATERYFLEGALASRAFYSEKVCGTTPGRPYSVTDEGGKDGSCDNINALANPDCYAMPKAIAVQERHDQLTAHCDRYGDGEGCKEAQSATVLSTGVALGPIKTVNTLPKSKATMTTSAYRGDRLASQDEFASGSAMRTAALVTRMGAGAAASAPVTHGSVYPRAMNGSTCSGK